MILISLVYRKNRKEWLLTFDNGESLTVNEDIKVKYSLQLHKDISEERFSTLKTEAEHVFAYEKAIELLSYREHSSFELKSKLLQKGFSGSVIESVIETMISKGYLDDDRFTDLYFRELIRQGKYGPLMIRKKMLEKGITSDIVDRKIRSVSQKEWEQYATGLLKKKMQKIQYRGKDKREILLRYLMNKGFDYGSIESLIKSAVENDENS